MDLRPSTDDILAGFSGDARKNIRNTDSDRYEVTRGGVEFVTEFYEALSADSIRPYIVTVDGSRVTGMVTIWFGDRVYRWQGGVRTDVDVPTSELLDWHIICEAKDAGIVASDLLGANLCRLTQYKLKFGPTLQTYYNVHGQNRQLQIANQVQSVAGTGLDRIRNRIETAVESVSDDDPSR